MSVIQNDVNIVNSFPCILIGYLKKTIGWKVDSLQAENWTWELA